MHPRPTLLVLTLLACATSQAIAAPDPLVWEAGGRLRDESVADDAFARNASATTLRVHAGLRWHIAPGWQAFAEAEGVAALDDDYNSGANRRTEFPAVIDPTGVELNQAWLRWQSDRASVTAGRQRLQLDNQRWIGNVGWRQNEQTFDAVSVGWKPAAPVALTLAWLDRAHRISGDDAVDPLARERDLDAHLVNAAWLRGDHRLVGYAYAIEDQDVARASTRTLGLRYVLAPKAGTRPFGLTLDAAQQADHAGNPLDFRHDYWLVEPALALPRATVRVGWEHLGGDGRHALQTPLATLHAFNGWADKFLATPAGGLEDRYVSAGGKFASTRRDGALEWLVAWHDYRADAGGQRYGSELDASLAVPFGPHWKGVAKVADYRAESFARDTTKLWLQLEWTARVP